MQKIRLQTAIDEQTYAKLKQYGENKHCETDSQTLRVLLNDFFANEKAN